ncbi:MAG: cysteine hydrolase family protein [Streptosporangiaceae bacterium]
MSNVLGLDDIQPAAVVVDMHRGHLDPVVATMPLSPLDVARIVPATRDFLVTCRGRGFPVIHLVTGYRDAAEISVNPFWRTSSEDPRSSRRAVLRHNLIGSPGCQVAEELLGPTDIIVSTKKRYDCFRATDLDFTLRAHGVNTLLICGVNTNSCILSTTAAACSLDYAAVVIEDCVATMDGPALHDAALACIRAAFGWTASSDGVWKLLAEGAL